MQKKHNNFLNLRAGFPTQAPTMVCGRRMTSHTEAAIRANHQGSTLYFCTESCLNAFNADPERFYCAHSTPKS